MKRAIAYICASAVLILSASGTAFGIGKNVPEPGTIALLCGLAVGGLIAIKIIRRK